MSEEAPVKETAPGHEGIVTPKSGIVSMIICRTFLESSHLRD